MIDMSSEAVKKRQKIALKVMLTVFALVCVFGLIMNMHTPKTIAELEKHLNKEKRLRPNVKVRGTVISPGGSLTEVKRGSTEMMSFGLKDETGAMRFYYDPNDVDYEPKIGDKVVVYGTVERVFGLISGFRLIVTDIKPD